VSKNHIFHVKKKGESSPEKNLIIVIVITTRGVSHCGLAIYIKKYLNAKEELWKLIYFTMKKYNLQKILQKKQKSFKIL
jgi:hypothetical protein